jgi:hypothetical protein
MSLYEQTRNNCRSGRYEEFPRMEDLKINREIGAGWRRREGGIFLRLNAEDIESIIERARECRKEKIYAGLIINDYKRFSRENAPDYSLFEAAPVRRYR